MQSLIKTRACRPGKSGPVFFDLSKAIDSSRGTASGPLVRIATTLGCASILLSPCVSFAAPNTIEISPLVTKSTYFAAVDANHEIAVTLCLPLSDPKGAAEFARRVSTPGDSLFHQYITPEEFAARDCRSAP